MKTNNKTIHHLFHTDREVQDRIKYIVISSNNDITSKQVQSSVKEFKGVFSTSSCGGLVPSSWLCFDKTLTDEELEIFK